MFCVTAKLMSKTIDPIKLNSSSARCARTMSDILSDYHRHLDVKNLIKVLHENDADVKINRTSKRDKNVPEHTFVGKIIEIHPTFFVVERTDLPKRLDGYQTPYTTTFHYFDIQDELFQMRDPETDQLYYQRHNRDLTME